MDDFILNLVQRSVGPSLLAGAGTVVAPAARPDRGPGVAEGETEQPEWVEARVGEPVPAARPARSTNDRETMGADGRPAPMTRPTATPPPTPAAFRIHPAAVRTPQEPVPPAPAWPSPGPPSRSLSMTGFVTASEARTESPPDSERTRARALTTPAESEPTALASEPSARVVDAAPPRETGGATRPAAIDRHRDDGRRLAHRTPATPASVRPPAVVTPVEPASAPRELIAPAAPPLAPPGLPRVRPVSPEPAAITVLQRAKKAPAPSRTHVRIGTVEIRAAAARTPDPRPAGPQARGFDRYRRLRAYAGGA